MMWRRHQLLAQSAVQRWLFPCSSRQGDAVTTAAARRWYGAGGHQQVFYSTCVNKTSPAIFGSSHWHYRIQNAHSNDRTNNYSFQSAVSFSTERKGRKSPPRFSDDSTVDELVQIAHDNLDVMTPLATAALWNKISRQLSRRDDRSNNRHRGPRNSERQQIMGDSQMERKLNDVFQNTRDGLGAFNMRELSQTIYSMAKAVDILRKQGKKRGEADHKRILRQLLLNKSLTPNEELFQLFAGKAMDKLNQFDARHLSNLAYAYALTAYVPDFDDGSDLFDHIAIKAVGKTKEFNEQDISNMVWAYATIKKPHPTLYAAMGDQVVEFKHLGEFKPQALKDVVWAYATAGVHHPKLFEKVANHIIGLDSLDRFEPQACSNTLWAYAKADVSHPNLFEKVANHIVGSDHLNRFDPQNLKDIVWAFATAGIHHPKLFEKIANHIIGLDSLDQFEPQHLSNTVWAYAKAGIHHPKLFQKMANHIVGLNSLHRFNEQELANTVWAYATAQVPHPKLFHKVSRAVIQRNEEFNNSQGVANLLLAYATMGIVDKQLFSSFVPTAVKLIDSYNNQDFANIAWAYSVADVDAPTLFNDRFINLCVVKKDGFENEALRQLYQWHLWQTKENSNPGLPLELQDKCYNTFISEEPKPSKLQDDVVAQLSSIGMEPQDEVLMDSGYRIDAVVDVNGKTVGVEVDGPSHFIGKGRSPTGSTILKRRQVPSIDGIKLVSVPYWEWNKLGKDQMKRREYLRELLGLATPN